MQYLGIEYQMKHAPKLDPTFIPFGVWRAAYLKEEKSPLPSLLSVIRAVFPFIKPLFMEHLRWLRRTIAMWSAM